MKKYFTKKEENKYYTANLRLLWNNSQKKIDIRSTKPNKN
jgi:hypothetical protein